MPGAPTTRSAYPSPLRSPAPAIEAPKASPATGGSSRTSGELTIPPALPRKTVTVP